MKDIFNSEKRIRVHPILLRLMLMALFAPLGGNPVQAAPQTSQGWEGLPRYNGELIDTSLVVTDPQHRQDLLNGDIPKDIVVKTPQGDRRVTLNQNLGPSSWTARWAATVTDAEGNAKDKTCATSSRAEFSQLCN